MTLIEALQVNPDSSSVISFCGGGGKTSSMFTLARELKALGKSVLIATTTKIFIPVLQEYDQLVITNDVTKIPSLPSTSGNITVWGPQIVFSKLKLDSILFEALDQLRESKIFQFILIEADGAQCRPIKAPAEHEPVVYPQTDIMVGVTGFDSYQKTLSDEWVHRPERLAKISDQKQGSAITKKTYLALIQSPIGIFKNAPQNAKKIWILNKVDDEKQLDQAIQISKSIKKQSTELDKVLITCLKSKRYIKYLIK